MRDKPCDAGCIRLTLLHCCLGNPKSRWGPPQQYLWGMGYPLPKCFTPSPANSAACPPPAAATSRFESSTRLWLVHLELSLAIALLPALLRLSPSRLSACGKGLGSSYSSSQPHLRSRLGCMILLRSLRVRSSAPTATVVIPATRGWCTSSLSVDVRQSAQTCRIPISQTQKAVTA